MKRYHAVRVYGHHSFHLPLSGEAVTLCVRGWGAAEGFVMPFKVREKGREEKGGQRGQNDIHNEELSQEREVRVGRKRSFPIISSAL